MPPFDDLGFELVCRPVEIDPEVGCEHASGKNARRPAQRRAAWYMNCSLTGRMDCGEFGAAISASQSRLRPIAAGPVNRWNGQGQAIGNFMFLRLNVYKWA